MATTGKGAGTRVGHPQNGDLYIATLNESRYFSLISHRCSETPFMLFRKRTMVYAMVIVYRYHVRYVLKMDNIRGYKESILGNSNM